MSYHKRLTLLASLDSLIVIFAVYLSYIPLHPSVQTLDYPQISLSAVVLLGSHHLFASVFLLYNKAWEYASVGELLGITKAVTFSVLMVALFQYAMDFQIYGRVLVRDRKSVV